MDKDCILEVENLSFSYEEGIPVIKNLSFKARKGEYIALIGHNGSGKSTLSKLLCYLLTPTSGKIFLFGEEMNEKNITKIRQNIGIVFQNPDNQFIGSTVEADIAFGLENRNIERAKMLELVRKYAALVGMGNFLSKAPDELSGGQKQRVSIAGILALGLKVIIFDEATSMLDPEGVSEIKNLLERMRAEDPELTIISITHDIEEAYLASRVIILNKGEIVRDGDPKEIFKDYDYIESLNLNVPFVLKAKKALSDKGIAVEDNITTLEELARYLCK